MRACLALALALTPAALAAQTVTGRVIDSASHRPLAQVSVRLVPGTDSVRDTVFATASTASDGVFILLAPAPGRYRVRIGDSHVGPPLVLATVDDVDEHAYIVGIAPSGPVLPGPVAGDVPDRVYEEKETTVKARLLPGGEMPHLSESHLARTTRGGPESTWRATIECVVDTRGQCEAGTPRIVTTSDAQYGRLMRDYVAAAQFSPARVGERLVRQRVALSYSATMRTEVRRVPGP